MARRQVGATLLGYIILVIFVGVFAFGVIRLTPVYLNYMKVVGVIDGVFNEFDGQKPTRAMLRSSISRRLCRSAFSSGVLKLKGDHSITKTRCSFAPEDFARDAANRIARADWSVPSTPTIKTSVMLFPPLPASTCT